MLVRVRTETDRKQEVGRLRDRESRKYMRPQDNWGF